jgi:hypothetical protein
VKETKEERMGTKVGRKQRKGGKGEIKEENE